MSSYHELLKQLDTIVKGDNFTTAHVEKLITELKVYFHLSSLTHFNERFGQILLTLHRNH